MEIFDSCVHRGDAGANWKFFKFEIGNTGFIRGNRVTWCPDDISTANPAPKLNHAPVRVLFRQPDGDVVDPLVLGSQSNHCLLPTMAPQSTRCKRVYKLPEIQIPRCLMLRNCRSNANQIFLFHVLFTWIHVPLLRQEKKKFLVHLAS
jgi:hypothetical protein